MSVGALFPFAPAGYAFVQSAGNNAASTTSVTATLGSAPASGDLVVAAIGTSTGSNTSPPTSTGATWTLAVQSADQRCAIYFSTTCTTAAATAHFTSAGNLMLTLIHATGASASPLDQVNHSATVDPGSITPTQGGEFIVSAILTNGTITATPSGYTALTDQGASYNSQAAYLIQATAAATDPAWTQSGAATNAAAVASFKHA